MTFSNRSFVHHSGKTYKAGDPDYQDAQIDELEHTCRELQQAIVDLQNRVSSLDKQALVWPADTYEPRDAPPFDG